MIKHFYILVLIITLAFGCCKKTDESNISDIKNENGSFQKLDSNAILDSLFSPTMINSNGVAYHKPDYSERLLFGKSKNEFLYTWIDTIMNCTYFNQKIYIVIFNTNVNPDKEVSTCHICSHTFSVATFIQNDDGYMVNSFKKYVGSFGEYGVKPKIEIERFSKNSYFLKIENVHSGCGGSDYQTYSYYDLNSLNMVFEYCYSFKWHSQDFFGDGYDSADKATELVHISGKSGYYDTLVLKETGFITDDELRSKPIKGSDIEKIRVNTESVYYYDDAFGKYQKK